MKYNIEKKSYFYTKRKNGNILIYPLTNFAKQELNFTKENLIHLVELISTSTIEVNKNLTKSVKRIKENLKTNKSHLMINREDLLLIDNISKNIFITDKISKVAGDKLPKEFQIYYKISKFFIDSILKIK